MTRLCTVHVGACSRTPPFTIHITDSTSFTPLAHSTKPQHHTKHHVLPLPTKYSIPQNKPTPIRPHPPTHKSQNLIRHETPPQTEDASSGSTSSRSTARRTFCSGWRLKTTGSCKRHTQERRGLDPSTRTTSPSSPPKRCRRTSLILTSLL